MYKSFQTHSCHRQLLKIKYYYGVAYVLLQTGRNHDRTDKQCLRTLHSQYRTGYCCNLDVNLLLRHLFASIALCSSDLGACLYHNNAISINLRLRRQRFVGCVGCSFIYGYVSSYISLRSYRFAKSLLHLFAQHITYPPKKCPRCMKCF